jgi:two-component system, cell cycle response regulator
MMVVPRQLREDEDEPTKIGRLDDVRASKPRSQDKAYFIVLAGTNLGQMYKIDVGETVLGRAADATIRLQDDGISRRHAKVEQVGKDLVIEDLQSANGTVINGKVVGRHALKDGDKIQIGSTTILKFTYHDELEESFQQKMYDAALHDGLTKAFNKRHFLDRMPTEIAYARRHTSPLTLLMLDADHFKQVNDRYGHLAGDQVLVTLADLVRGTIRTEDFFGRYGGEEFVVLCRGVSLGNASILAERLRTIVETNSFEYQGQRMPVTISIGVAALSDRMDEAGTALVADADAALYEAKRGGRNRVVSRTRST